jgi:hypothetical protein
MQAERGLAGGRAAVDAHHTARQGGLAARRLQAGADGQAPVGGVQGGSDRPAGRGRLLVASGSAHLATANLIEPCPAQAAARHQEAERLQEVGLARAVGAHQHDRRQVAVEPQLAVVAEIAEPQLAHGEQRRRCTGNGVGGIGKGVDRRRRHTRIGMST